MKVNVHTKFRFLSPDAVITDFVVGEQEMDDVIALHPFNTEYLEIIELPLEIIELPVKSKK